MGQDETSLINRRRHVRRKGFWRALAFLPGRASLNCVVRDISEGGARLEFTEAVRFPSRFKLYIEAHDREYECEVRHAGPHGVGVQFVAMRRCNQAAMVHFGRRSEVPALPAALTIAWDGAEMAEDQNTSGAGKAS